MWSFEALICASALALGAAGKCLSLRFSVFVTLNTFFTVALETTEAFVCICVTAGRAGAAWGQHPVAAGKRLLFDSVVFGMCPLVVPTPLTVPLHITPLNF